MKEKSHSDGKSPSRELKPQISQDYSNHRTRKPMTRKTHTIAFTLLIFVILAAAGCKEVDETTSQSLADYVDTTPPTVVSTTPADSSADVNPRTLSAIRVTFSEKIDERSLTAASFIVNDGSSDVAGVYNCSDKICSFSPNGNFYHSKSYSISLTSTIKDYSGVALKNAFTWTFGTISFSADAKSVRILRNSSRSFDLSTNKEDATNVTYSIVAGPSHGSVSISGSIAIYTPTTGYSGTDTFTYKANDGIEDSSTGTVSLEIKDGRLPDTGQTSSYTAIFGEDSDYTIKPPSYTDNGNGTVTDNVTGLVWQKTDDNTTHTHLSAGAFCENLTLGGQSDWRLPTVSELVGILHLGTYNPAINTTYFTGTNSSYYWSSTTYAYNTSYAWHVDFQGVNGMTYDYKTSYNYVRCVRGGQ